MSAVFGLVRWDGAPVDAVQLERMGRVLAHRGPDRVANEALGCAGLGHALARVNIEDWAERQPIAERDVAIAADLRLDNREELADALGLALAGDVPDSAVLLAAWRRWGEGCVERLVGDFALAIWDARRRSLLLARDHMGQRGLFLHHGHGFLAFASEVGALWAVDGVPRRLSEEGIGRALLFPIDPSDGDTLYDGITSLPGGTVATLGPDGVLQRRRYWEPHAAAEHVGRDDDHYRQAYERVLGEAVECRVRRLIRAPGLFFSGGFDSGVIATYAAPVVAAQGRRLVALSSVLAEDDTRPKSARGAVEAFRDVLPLDIRYWVRGRETAFSDLAAAFQTAEQSAAPSPTRTALFRLARDAGVRLVMDGMDGDVTLHTRAPAMLGKLLRRGRVVAFVKNWRARRRATGRSRRDLLLADTLPALIPLRWRSAVERARRGGKPIWRTRFAQHGFAKALFARGAIDAARLREPYPVHNRWEARWRHLLRKAAAAAPTQATLAAQHGLTFTRPFHDKRVVELALALPDHLRFDGGIDRVLARQVLGDRLPRRLLDRPPGNDAEAPDLYRMARDGAEEALARVQALDGDGRVSRHLDLDRIAETIATAREGRIRDHGRLDLACRSLALGEFIAWFEGANR